MEPFWANVFLYIIMSFINIISKIIVLLKEIHNNKFFTMVIDAFILRAMLQSGWMPSILNPCFILTERVNFNTFSPAFYHVSSRARRKTKQNTSLHMCHWLEWNHWKRHIRFEERSWTGEVPNVRGDKDNKEVICARLGCGTDRTYICRPSDNREVCGPYMEKLQLSR